VDGALLAGTADLLPEADELLEAESDLDELDVDESDVDELDVDELDESAPDEPDVPDEPDEPVPALLPLPDPARLSVR